jgi:hypothetical protein
MSNKIKKWFTLTSGAISSLILLVGSFGLVLIVPLFPVKIGGILFIIFYSIILIAAIYALNGNIKFRASVALIIALQLVGFFFEYDMLFEVVTLFTIGMFAWIVVKLVVDIVNREIVNSEVLIDAISVYMLLGIMFALFGQIIENTIPDAYSMGEEMDINEMFYYTFVTMSTLGYGEIVPMVPVAKSLAVLTSISGQFYLTLVIAVLVGKYLSAD